jgi:tetratricopeptide (TPR) repeat protein
MKARVALLGSDHPDTLRTRYKIAQLEWKNDPVAGRRELEELCRLSAGLRGDNYPQTLLLRHNLSAMLSREGNIVDAIRCQEKIYFQSIHASDLAETFRAKIKDQFVELLLMRGNRAATLSREGEWGLALWHQAEVRERLDDLLGPEHLETLRVSHNLALTLCRMKKYEEARRLLRDVLTRQRQSLGPEHLETKRSEKNLAQLEEEAARPST